MKIFVAADHAGLALKTELIERLQSQTQIKVEDLGTNSSESCDYPVYGEKAAKAVVAEPGSLGLLICGSGLGMSIAANKVARARAVCVSEPVSAALGREHNDANILCLGARIIGVETAWACVEAFLSAKFDSDHPRHKRRVDQLNALD